MMVSKDKAMGAYIGGAIGDAMGGPVEGLHFRRIQRLCGRITDFLPYSPPYFTGKVGKPGGAMHADAGSVTDDSFLRAELTRFFLRVERPWTPEKLARYFIDYANPDYFWPPKLEPLKRVAAGVVRAEEAGEAAPQGGGAAWWTPVGILNAGRPHEAALQARELCCIWKAPLEQDILACVQAAVAEGMCPEATCESMIHALLEQSGPLCRQLMERALRIARSATSEYDLIEKLYGEALMPELNGGVDSGVTHDRNAALPPHHPPIYDTDDPYITNSLAEQMPCALAVFYFCQGTADAITTAAMLGRDADSIATTVGSWVGALSGESGLPRRWVDKVCQVNMVEIDIRGLCEALLTLGEKP